MTEKMPSSVRFGSRPMMERMSWYSSAVRPCSAMMFGVMAGHVEAGAAGVPPEGAGAAFGAEAEGVGAGFGDNSGSLREGAWREFLQCGRKPVNDSPACRRCRPGNATFSGIFPRRKCRAPFGFWPKTAIPEKVIFRDRSHARKSRWGQGEVQHKVTKFTKRPGASARLGESVCLLAFPAWPEATPKSAAQQCAASKAGTASFVSFVTLW